MHKFLIGILAGLMLVLPVAARAQGVPSYATTPVAQDQDIHGRITSFDGGYNVAVRDERGYIDNVRLHPGTIINPTGLTLAPGMVVSVLGYNAGSYFSANQIDTPYTYYGGVPYYAGHPWNYYGPSISLGFFFGNVGWWHGNYFHGGYRFVGGARVYNHVAINNIYHYHGGAYRGRDFGEFHGRDFVARPEHGGYYGHVGAHPMMGGHPMGGHSMGGGHPMGGHPGGHPGR
jgi:hypothetical protein